MISYHYITEREKKKVDFLFFFGFERKNFKKEEEGAKKA